METLWDVIAFAIERALNNNLILNEFLKRREKILGSVT